MAKGRRVVFMGTSVFARDILAGLIRNGEEICAVYTQPDRPAGRGMEKKAPPAKELALEHNLPVFQPESFKNPEEIRKLQELEPDFLVVASYGLILPQAVLDTPAIAPLNIHASLLPEFRGAGPIQAAIMRNWQPNAKTGVSLMRIIKKMDAGPVYATAEVEIGHMNAEEIIPKLTEAGVNLLVEYLPQIARGEVEPREQDESMATYAPKLAKSDGIIDWNKPADMVDAHIRGVYPWPGAQTTIHAGDKAIPVLIMAGRPGVPADEPAGTVRLTKKELSIACSDNWYEIKSLKPQGRKTLSAAEFVNGLHLEPGIAGTAS